MFSSSIAAESLSDPIWLVFGCFGGGGKIKIRKVNLKEKEEVCFTLEMSGGRGGCGSCTILNMAAIGGSVKYGGELVIS